MQVVLARLGLSSDDDFDGSATVRALCPLCDQGSFRHQLMHLPSIVGPAFNREAVLVTEDSQSHLGLAKACLPPGMVLHYSPTLAGLSALRGL